MEETISYKLEKFEGPLDLLLSLIKKNKMQIEDIPISLICE
jgi:segregation and condensation protein A